MKIEEVGLRFVGRQGSVVELQVNDNEVVRGNLTPILKAACFCTACVFECDSHQREIVFRYKHKYFRGPIELVAFEMFLRTRDQDDDDSDEERSEWKNSEFPIQRVQCDHSDVRFWRADQMDQQVPIESWEYEIDQRDENEVTFLTPARVAALHHDLRNEMMKYDDQNQIILSRRSPSETPRRVKPWNQHPVFRVERQMELVESQALMDEPTCGLTHAWDFERDNCIPVLVTRCHDQMGCDDAGNWGSFIKSPRRSTPLESFPPISRYAAFDFDHFDIQVIPSDQLKEDTLPLSVTCRFEGLQGVHHAASMWAHNCLVHHFEDQPPKASYVDQVDIRVSTSSTPGLLDLHCTFLAINVL